MKRARAVIGANFGDEGKGLITDYLCAREGAGVVVRFNGGAQAGHTVVTPEGKRHVFHHFGSGTFCNVPTYLSEFFVLNPILFGEEIRELEALGLRTRVYAHPECIVTTFADMIINQRKEIARGARRHGSVGVGINETINRSTLPELRITMADLWNHSDIRKRLQVTCDKYARFRTREPIADSEPMIEAFMKGCEVFAAIVQPLGIAQCRDPVFEGAQGLLLDQNNLDYYPHLTRSNTGLQNVRALCMKGGFDLTDVYYVSRTYLTRHGAGPLHGEDPAMSFHDDTNTDHAYQGKLRFAPLDYTELWRRCALDAMSHGPIKLALTHCDQLAPPNDDRIALYGYGPTRDEVHERTFAITA